MKSGRKGKSFQTAKSKDLMIDSHHELSKIQRSRLSQKSNNKILPLNQLSTNAPMMQFEEIKEREVIDEAPTLSRPENRCIMTPNPTTNKISSLEQDIELRDDSHPNRNGTFGSREVSSQGTKSRFNTPNDLSSDRAVDFTF